MKKILLLIFLFCATKSFAQFPINAATGTPTTTVLTRGISAADSGYWYRTAFADTTALNRGRIDEIAGVLVRTSSNELWLRNNTATGWIQVLGSSGAVTSLTNGLTLSAGVGKLGGTLTEATTIAKAGFDFLMNGNGGVRFSTNTSDITLDADGVTGDVAISAGNALNLTGTTSLNINSLTNLSTQDRLLGIRTSTGQVGNITLGTGLSLSSGVLNTSGAAGGNVWSITGNSGTVAGTNFLGTTDAVDLAVKVNNNFSGYIDISGSTFWGYRASGTNPTVASQNTAIGASALFSNNPAGGGDVNVAVGHSSLFSNTTGDQNTAIGHSSMYYNLTGLDNTAVGANSLLNSVSSYNTAVGTYALFANVTTKNTGGLNTAIGHSALRAVTTGSQNFAGGMNALLLNTTGIKNTATGAGALENNTTGQENTAVGQDAGLNNTTGIYNNYFGVNAKGGTDGIGNNIIGYYSGASLTAGNQYNVGIGHNALYHASQKVDATKSTAIGYNAYTTANNQLSISDSTTRFTFPGVSRGTANYVLTDSLGTGQYWVARPVGAATSVPLSGITAATGTNSINNANYNQAWNWSTLGGNAIEFSTNSTASGSSSSVLNIRRSGTHAGSPSVTYGLYVDNLHFGSSNNVAAIFDARNGTNNYAIIVPSGGGSVGIGTSTPISLLHVVPVQTTGIGAEFISSTTTSGTILDITGTSTALAANNEGLNIGISGANGTNGITATGARISVTNTNATSGTNVGLDLTASGATTANNALNIAAGAIALNGSAGTSGQVLTSGGASTLPTWTTPSSGITVGTTTITSGTDKRVLYNNAGVVGNAAGVEIGNTNERLTLTSQATSEAALVAKNTGGSGYNAIIISPSDASNAYTPILRFKNTGGGGDAMFGQDYGVMQIDGSYAPGGGAADAEVRFGTLYNGVNNVSIKTYVYGSSSAPNNYTMKTRTPATGVLGQIIQWGAASQTANLLEFRNNSGTGLSAFDANGNLGIGNVTPTSALHTTAFATAYAAKTANYTITAADYTIEVTANSPTITLPTAVGCTGRMYFITNSGAGTVTLATTSSQVFRNVSGTPTSLSLGTLTGVLVQSNNADWLKIASF